MGGDEAVPPNTPTCCAQWLQLCRTSTRSVSTHRSVPRSSCGVQQWEDKRTVGAGQWNAELVYTGAALRAAQQLGGRPCAGLQGMCGHVEGANDTHTGALVPAHTAAAMHYSLVQQGWYRAVQETCLPAGPEQCRCLPTPAAWARCTCPGAACTIHQWEAAKAKQQSVMPSTRAPKQSSGAALKQSIKLRAPSVEGHQPAVASALAC